LDYYCGIVCVAYDPWSRVFLFWIVEAEVCAISHTLVIYITFCRHFSSTPLRPILLRKWLLIVVVLLGV